ncbi:MAG TPA: adenylosuccinate lyase, partial [Flavobacterium sp.]|nr:adenylosuccinate lyase [Flavobacterium sp.]
KPYEKLKALTRGSQSIGQAEIHAFIDTLDVSSEVKQELKQIKPENYTGVF